MQSRSPVAVEDASTDERLAEVDPLLREGYLGFLGVPLIAPEGAAHGVLAVYSRRPRRWRRDEIEALMALAANASAALSNAELYQRVAVEKERSFAILTNIADGIVAVDRDGTVVSWNRAAEQITGVPAHEALGRTPLQVLGRELQSDGDAAAGDRLVADPARPGGGVALADRGRHARPGGRGRGPDLRLPRHLVGAPRRADEVRLRLDGLGGDPRGR